MTRRRVSVVLFCFFAALFIFSAWQIATTLAAYQRASDYYEALRLLSNPPVEIRLASTDEPGVTAAAAPATVDFTRLCAANSDTVAWIRSDGTVIDYPVLQADDNAFYLTRLFDQSTSRSGSIFLDSRNQPDFSDAHSIIYGYHMKDGSMFYSLSNYKEQDYFDAHPRLRLETPAQCYDILLFAGYVADVKDDAWKIAFASSDEFGRWLSDAVARSCFVSDVSPAATDCVVTLSTCSYEFENARFVLLGVLRADSG